MNDHARWADAAGAYVLGAMPSGERDEFEAHLATCVVCREEVDELRPAAETLPMASPPRLPPPELKDRIMAEVEREAALLSSAGAGADRAEPRRRPGWLSGWRLAPVAAALLIAGVLLGTALSGPDSATYAFDRPGAQLEVEGDTATLVARDLPAPPDGRVYEVWLMPEGSDTPRPTNVLFMPRGDGSAEAAVPSLDGVRAVLVSDEPRGGSETPTGEVLMSAEIS
jgi:anti-sigma-K factor RskA